MLGPTDPASLAWLAEHWGTRAPAPGSRAAEGAAGAASAGGACRWSATGFSPTATTPQARSRRLGARWPALRFALRPRPPARGRWTPHAAGPASGQGRGRARTSRSTVLPVRLASLLSLARGPTPSIWRASRSPTASARWRRRWNRPLPRSRSPAKADWLVMAAWLVLLRSRLLLPAAPAEPAGAADADRRADRGRDCWPPRRSPPGSRGGRNLASTSSLAGNRSRSGRKSAPGTRSTSSNFSGPAWPSSRAIRTTSIATAPSTVRPGYGLCSVLDARARLLRLLPEGSAETPLGWFLPELPAAAENEALARITLRRRSAVASTLLAGLELAREGWLTRAAEGAVRHDHARGPYRGEAGSDPGCGLNCGSR